MKTQKIEVLWTHLHWLTVLAQQGSFTAAAQRLGVSKAAMSQRIAELERAAGVPLVQRTTRSVRLTEAGQRLVDDMRDPFERIAHSFEDVRELAGVPTGLLRGTAPVAFARQQLVPRVAEFLRANPKVGLELDLSDRLSSLAMEGFDLAIRHTATPPDTHVAWTLCTTRSVLVASRAYLRRRGTPARPEELTAHDCLHCARPRHASMALSRKARSRGVSTHDGSSLGMLCREQQRGTARSGDRRTWDCADARLQRAGGTSIGQACRVLTKWQPVGAFGEKLFAVRPYASQVPLAVSAFVEWIRAQLSKGFDVAPRKATVS